MINFTNLFSSQNFKKNDKVILDYFLNPYDSDSVKSKKKKKFIAEINDREKMSRTLKKNNTALDCADKTLLGVSFCSSAN